MAANENNRGNSFGAKKIARELRPHILWDGIKEVVKWLPAAGKALLITGVLWLWQTVQPYRDYIGIAIVFFAGSAIIYLTDRRNKMLNTRVPEGESDVPTVVTNLAVSEVEVSPQIAFTIAMKQLERAPADSVWVFKSKLRITVTNATGKDVEVLAPEWLAHKNDVPAQRPQGFCSLQREGDRGWKANDWRSEVGRLHVAQGDTFRLWIGLDQSYSDDDLKRRAENQRLGTLVLPLKIDGNYVEFTKRF